MSQLTIDDVKDPVILQRWIEATEARVASVKNRLRRLESTIETLGEDAVDLTIVNMVADAQAQRLVDATEPVDVEQIRVDVEEERRRPVEEEEGETEPRER